MRIVPLGTTGYHPNDIRHTACYVLPEVGVVLDAGTGIYRLKRFLQTDAIDIFITHAHLDHIGGLTYLLAIFGDRSTHKVTVHGAAHKLQSIREHLFDRDVFPVDIDVTWKPLPDDGPVPLQGGGKLTHYPLVHPGGARGFRLDWPGHTMAYVSDVMATPGAPYLDAIRGVDLLLHECNFADADASDEFAARTGHSRTSEAARAAKEAGVKRLVLIHLAPHRAQVDPVGLDTARKIFPNTEVAEDLKEITF